jgi:hypothetical protein
MGMHVENCYKTSHKVYFYSNVSTPFWTENFFRTKDKQNDFSSVLFTTFSL